MWDLSDDQWEIVSLLHERDYLKSLLTEARDALQLRPHPTPLLRLCEQIEAAVGEGLPNAN